MATTVTIASLHDEDALSQLIAFLRTGPLQSGRRSPSPNSAQTIDLLALLRERLDEAGRQQRSQAAPMTRIRYDHVTNTGPYFNAAWELVRRGVLRPARPEEQIPADPGHVGEPAAQFVMTAYGRDWLTAAEGYEYLPAETGRFSAQLASYATRFGHGYHARSQEALACHRAQAYLACCAMCGAAAESITLQLAIARATANRETEAEVRAEYNKSRGRAAIERRLAQGQNAHVQRELGTFLSLLGYWRDDAAHGGTSRLEEREAFVALLLLLRFAQFGADRWDELTTS